MSGSVNSIAFQPLRPIDTLIDQERAVRFLRVTLRKGVQPNAFLFSGIAGVGKQRAAIAYAMACNCLSIKKEKSFSGDVGSSGDEQPRNDEWICGHCRSCRKILNGQHPDVIQIEPAGNAIKIDQIREISRRLTLKPHEADIRVVIINDAEKMNTEAGNALLKVLEEPPERTLLILITQQSSDLLSTIVSRCRQLRFNPVSATGLSTFLMGKYDLDPDQARILAEMADGSLQRAICMKETDWLRWRGWLLEEISSLHHRSIGGRLAFSERLVKAKDRLSDALDIYQSWFRDRIIYPDAPDRVINRDMIQKIDALSNVQRRPILLEQLDAVRIARRRMEMNANLRLVMDTLIMRVTGLEI